MCQNHKAQGRGGGTLFQVAPVLQELPGMKADSMGKGPLFDHPGHQQTLRVEGGSGRHLHPGL
jgi:hypothetical protein